EVGHFFNPWSRLPLTGFSSLLRWKLGKNPYDKKRPPEIPVVANDGAYLKDRGQPPSVTWVGHSTFAIQDGGDVVLTDPHWGARALLPKRHSPPGIPLSSLPEGALPCFPIITTTIWTRGRCGGFPRRCRGSSPWGSRSGSATGDAGRWWSSTGGRASGTDGGPSPACPPSTGPNGSESPATPVCGARGS